MKKLFTTITSFGTITALTSMLCNIQENTKSKIEASHTNTLTIWKNVGINHNVDSQMTDIEKNEDIKTTSKSTAKINWEDIISKVEFVNVHGRFALVIDMWIKCEDTLKLKLDKDQSSKNTRIWSYEYGHSRNSNWGCLTSKLKLTLKSTYNSEEGTTSFEMISYIYVKPTTLCFTISQVDKIQFLY